MDGLMNEVGKYGQSCPERRKELADFGVCVCGKEREHKLSSGGTGKTRISAIRRIPSLSIVRFCGKEFRPSREMMRRVRERERKRRVRVHIGVDQSSSEFLMEGYPKETRLAVFSEMVWLYRSGFRAISGSPPCLLRLRFVLTFHFSQFLFFFRLNYKLSLRLFLITLGILFFIILKHLLA